MKKRLIALLLVLVGGRRRSLNCSTPVLPEPTRWKHGMSTRTAYSNTRNIALMSSDNFITKRTGGMRKHTACSIINDF